MQICSRELCEDRRAIRRNHSFFIFWKFNPVHETIETCRKRTPPHPSPRKEFFCTVYLAPMLCKFFVFWATPT